MSIPRLATALGLAACMSLASGRLGADGKVVPPRDYEGSLEETAQEAILIFHSSDETGGASEDLILKVRVQGEASQFAWVIPFPNPPAIAREDPALFPELHRFVQARAPRRKSAQETGEDRAAEGTAPGVEVLARKVVGSFDTAVVRETEPGALNEWLADNGFQELPDAEDVLGFYREKGYVFACIRVSDAALSKDEPVDIHPLRFSFETGGRDGIYYPMKMTGLQTKPFDVVLYVFYRYWLNDRLNKYGFVHRGFRLAYRDWDTEACVPNGGKAYSDPHDDPFLAPYARHIPTVVRLFQKLRPGERYYLTKLQARGLDPRDVRHWSDDLWLFPHYRDRDVVPFDARPGGPASAAWPAAARAEAQRGGADPTSWRGRPSSPWAYLGFALLAVAVAGGGIYLLRRKGPASG
ncbi:MAG: DUF2330 domain-containing protein [Candidatus Brocadiia bacterium]